MPTVPVRNSPGVAPTGGNLRSIRTPGIDAPMQRAPQFATPQLVTGKVRGTSARPDLVAGITPEAAAMPGRQLSAAGQALTGLSADAARIITDIQAQANGLVVDNAVNQSKEAAMRLAYDKDAGFTSLRGYDALNRPDGKSLAEEYLGKFDEATQSIAKGLKNDPQRQAFANERAGLRMSLEAQAVQHETAQFREYNISTQEGTISTETDNVGRNYNNPEITNQAVSRIKGATYMLGKALGKSATWIEAKQRDATSKAHVSALKGAITDTNLGFADAYIKAHASEMTADDLLEYRGMVNKEVDNRVALTAAAEAMGAIAPAMGGDTEMGKVRAITRQMESGDRETDAQGNRITSSAGARGRMQVMPNTAKDPGFGIKPSDGSAADDVRVGNEYLDKMLSRYAGDVGKMWAAYNAGPGRVDDAIAKAKKTGGNWLRYMPDETKKYVTKGLTKLGGGGRAPPPTLADAISLLDKRPLLAESPARMKIARAEVEYRFNIAEKATKDAQDTAREQALTAIYSGASFASLPASTRNALDPDDFDTVFAASERMAKGEPVKTDMSLYYLLKRDPAALGKANLMAFQDKLAPTELKDLITDQAALRKGGSQYTRVQTDKQMIDMRLAQMGIKPNPGDKPSDKKDRELNGRVWAGYSQRLQEFETSAGRKATDKEREGVIDRMLLTVDVKGQGKTPMVLLTSESQVDIPKAERVLIESALTRAGRPVTEQTVLSLYLTKVKTTGDAGGK